MKFYQKNWFIWLSLIFFAPLGIILLWTQKKYKPFPRVILSIIFLIFFIIVLPKGEVNETDTANRSEPNVEITKEGKMALDNKNIDLLFSNPKEYKGANIEFTGRVFVKPERDKNSVYLQVFSDPKNSEGNIAVSHNDPNLPVDTDSYVKISGVVKGEMKGTNVFGATLSIPMVEAQSIEIVDYITAVSPTLETINVDSEINQHGLIVALNKIEFAEDETRVYLKVKNNSNDSVSIWKHSAKVVQGNKQFEYEYNFLADYPEIQNDLLPGVESEGIIPFPPMDPEQSLRFIIEGSCDDYTLKVNPFEFEINQ
jgi:hypothetical protein